MVHQVFGRTRLFVYGVELKESSAIWSDIWEVSVACFFQKYLERCSAVSYLSIFFIYKIVTNTSAVSIVNRNERMFEMLETFEERSVLCFNCCCRQRPETNDFHPYDGKRTGDISE